MGFRRQRHGEVCVREVGAEGTRGDRPWRGKEARKDGEGVMGRWGRPPLPPPPASDCTPAVAPVHSPHAPPFSLPQEHHQRLGEEPASLGPPHLSIRLRQGGTPQWGFATGQVYFRG